MLWGVVPSLIPVFQLFPPNSPAMLNLMLYFLHFSHSEHPPIPDLFFGGWFTPIPSLGHEFSIRSSLFCHHRCPGTGLKTQLLIKQHCFFLIRKTPGLLIIDKKKI